MRHIYVSIIRKKLRALYMEPGLAISIMWLSIIWMNFDPLRNQVIFGIWGFVQHLFLGFLWFVCFVLPPVEVAKGFPSVVIGSILCCILQVNFVPLGVLGCGYFLVCLGYVCYLPGVGES
jgi:hypothetical protein